MRNLHVYYIYAPDREIQTMTFLPFFPILFYFMIINMIGLDLLIYDIFVHWPKLKILGAFYEKVYEKVITKFWGGGNLPLDLLLPNSR